MKGAKMVDFSKLLSPEQRERIAAVQQEVERLYGLSDRWLGEALLKLARETRAEFPDLAVNPHGLSYDANFVWHVVPEVAKRLGARNLQPNEGISQNIASMNDDALRCTVGAYLHNIAIDRMGMSVKGPRPTAAEILAHSLPNGNPVAFAVDRIAPAPLPGEDTDDWIRSEEHTSALQSLMRN